MNQIKAFFEKAKTDNELMAKLNELGEKEAQEEEIIRLAAENGFTITAEEIEQARNTQLTGELSEEELDKVAGGSLTQNRWNPEKCKEYGRTYHNCYGFLDLVRCDHYRQFATSQRSDTRHHICAMGVFDYIGNPKGEPI